MYLWRNECELSRPVGILTTSEFVAAVVAVQYAVTLVRFLYALSEVGAFELGRRTRDRRTTFFVLVIETVVVAVAHPRLRDAVTGPGTRELHKTVLLSSKHHVTIFVRENHVSKFFSSGIREAKTASCRRYAHLYVTIFIGSFSLT